jgi:hypothetical protein
MRSALLAGWVLLLAGCASVAEPEAPPVEPDPGPPDILDGLPAAVAADLAIFDLDSGDPERAARARGVLVALPAASCVDALLGRARTDPPGSDARLEILAVLAERGEPLEEFPAVEVVAMSLREIARREPASRPALLALDRLRGMGEAALPPLREAAESDPPRAELAARLLELLFGEIVERRLRGARP